MPRLRPCAEARRQASILVRAASASHRIAGAVTSDGHRVPICQSSSLPFPLPTSARPDLSAGPWTTRLVSEAKHSRPAHTPTHPEPLTLTPLYHPEPTTRLCARHPTPPARIHSGPRHRPEMGTLDPNAAQAVGRNVKGARGESKNGTTAGQKRDGARTGERGVSSVHYVRRRGTRDCTLLLHLHCITAP